MKVGLWETGPDLLQIPLGHFLGFLWFSSQSGHGRNIIENKTKSISRKLRAHRRAESQAAEAQTHEHPMSRYTEMNEYQFRSS